MSNEAHEKGIEAACAVHPMYMRSDVFQEMLREYLSASGLVLVPREPTDEMVKRTGIAQTVNARANRRGIYRDFLRYAPNPFESKQDE